MFNYTGANKANKKQIKKLQKQIDKSEVISQSLNPMGNTIRAPALRAVKIIIIKIIIAIINRLRRGNLMVIKFSVIIV